MNMYTFVWSMELVMTIFMQGGVWEKMVGISGAAYYGRILKVAYAKSCVGIARNHRDRDIL